MDLDVLEVTPAVLIDSEPINTQIVDNSHKNSCASYGGNRKGSRECNQALIKIKFNEINECIIRRFNNSKGIRQEFQSKS